MTAGIKMTIVLDPNIYNLLKEYSFTKDYRSKNNAVTHIVTNEILKWDDARKAEGNTH